MIHFNKSYENEAISKEEGDDVKETMNKGPWTPQEDVTLRDYVSTYGEGMWNSVYKRSGLARCGKSCRLRWVNHLKPNLKKGAFSKEEEQLVIQLHAQLGNKWARMSVQLPGRTDNEIKNFWNTRLKKCLKEGLPIYPSEIVQHQPREQQQFTQPQYSPQLSFSSFISSSCSQELNNLSQFFTANPQQKDPNSYPQFNFPKVNNGSTSNASFPLSLISQYGYPWFNQCFAANGSYDYQSGSYNHGLDSNAVIGGSSYESCSLVQGLNTELSSSLSPPGSTTPISSYFSGVYGLVGASSMANAYYEVEPLSLGFTTPVLSYVSGVPGLMGDSSMARAYYEVESLPSKENGGMLDSLLVDAQSPLPKDKSNNEDSTTAGKFSYKRKNIAIEEDDSVHIEPTMKNSAKFTNNPQAVDLNSSQFSTGKKSITEGTLEGMNSMDDDLFSLLNNFPSETPVPGWYHNGETKSLGLETQQDAFSTALTDEELDRTLETFWNNMPNI